MSGTNFACTNPGSYTQCLHLQGQLTADDRHRMGAILRKALRRGVSHKLTDLLPATSCWIFTV